MVFFAIFWQAILPKEFVRTKSDKLLGETGCGKWFASHFLDSWNGGTWTWINFARR
jgi:hypothetical protein